MTSVWHYKWIVTYDLDTAHLTRNECRRLDKLPAIFFSLSKVLEEMLHSSICSYKGYLKKRISQWILSLKKIYIDRNTLQSLVQKHKKGTQAFNFIPELLSSKKINVRLFTEFSVGSISIYFPLVRFWGQFLILEPITAVGDHLVLARHSLFISSSLVFSRGRWLVWKKNERGRYKIYCRFHCWTGM